VGWLEARPSKGAYRQAQNLVAIAQGLCTKDPGLVAGLYRGIEKRLKDLGDKRLVLRLADISIHAAGRVVPQTEETARSRAHAMVCGFSWSYQRLGKLDLALTHAKDSLDLGQKIGWVRNTAFCEKCTGRLLRLQAELSADEQVRTTRLAESAERLGKATTAFQDDVELPLGKRLEERGDCQSLLGRTLLVAGKIDDATQAAERASTLLDQTHGKAYVDLQILRADLSLARGEPDDAEAYAGAARDALGDMGADAGELRGRLQMTMGRISRRRGPPGEADRHFAAAEKTGQQLGDTILVAEAQWARLAPTVDETARKTLRSEPTAVRVRAIELYKRAIETRPAAARRSQTRAAQPPKEYWLKLIEDARRLTAIEDGGVV
jgi:tetratricopeptide (TPR) repeat protein